MRSTPPFLCATRLRALVLFIITCAVSFAAQSADGARRMFDVPADAAEKSLRRFSEQSGLEVFYPSSAAKGVRTHAVKGEMTAREALDQMVAGTVLTVVRDEKSGAFSFKRIDGPNGP